MRLLPRRASGAIITIVPDRPVLPAAAITATVSLAEQVDDVTDARVELGYLNTYTYEWARGGSSPGGYKDATDWISAGHAPIVFAGGSLPAGTHSVTLRVPSWAPPTAEGVVHWVVRLVIDARGRAPGAEAAFVVLAPVPEPRPTAMRQVQHEHAVTVVTRLDLTTDATAYRLGSEVRGTISVTPTEPVRKTATATILFYRPQISHPRERNPAPRSDSWTRPRVTIAEDLALAEGTTTEIPFTVRLPDDGGPTLEAVHSSLEWWVEATITFSGLTGGVEKVRREIVVGNA